MAMIELQGISKTYTRPTGETVEALAGVSFQIERGEFVAIVGSSGSGKPPPMNILGLLDLPSQGHYRLDGHHVAALPVNHQAGRRHKKVGRVYQTIPLPPRTS